MIPAHLLLSLLSVTTPAHAGPRADVRALAEVVAQAVDTHDRASFLEACTWAFRTAPTSSAEALAGPLFDDADASVRGSALRVFGPVAMLTLRLRDHDAYARLRLRLDQVGKGWRVSAAVTDDADWRWMLASFPPLSARDLRLAAPGREPAAALLGALATRDPEAVRALSDDDAAADALVGWLGAKLELAPVGLATAGGVALLTLELRPGDGPPTGEVAYVRLVAGPDGTEGAWRVAGVTQDEATVAAWKAAAEASASPAPSSP
jgi:hypothetical protein